MTDGADSAKGIAAKVRERARLSHRWTPQDSVDDLTQAFHITCAMYSITKPSQILLVLQEVISPETSNLLGASLVDHQTFKPKLTKEETYIEDLLAILRQLFVPQVHPFEHSQDLLTLKYKPSPETSLSTFLDTFYAKYRANLYALLGKEEFPKGLYLDKNPQFLRAAAEAMPEFIRTAYLTRNGDKSRATTFKELRDELISIERDFAHKQRKNLPMSTATSSPSSMPSSPKKDKDKRTDHPPKPAIDKSKPPPNPCKICNKGLYHWSADCPEKDKRPAQNLRNKEAKSSGSVLAIETYAGRPGSRPPGVPTLVGFGDTHLTTWGVFDDCNMAASLVALSLAKTLKIPLSSPNDFIQLGGRPQPIHGYAMVDLSVLHDKRRRPVYIVEDNAIPMPGCKILMTLDDAMDLEVDRLKDRTTRVNGTILETTLDYANKIPTMPTHSRGLVLATRKPSTDDEADTGRRADLSAIEFLTAPETRTVYTMPDVSETSTEFIGEDPMPGLTLKFEPGTTVTKLINLNGLEISYTVGADLAPALYARLDSILLKYEKRFYYKGRIFSHRLPVKHHIKTTGQPRKVPPREYHGVKLEAARAILKDWRQRGLVRISEHPKARLYENPLHVVPKDPSKATLTDAYRATADGRATNETTVRNRPPSSKTVRTVASEIAKLKYISKLDGKDFYLQVEIAEEDKHKSAFTFEGVKYEFIGAIFGLAFPGDTVEEVLDILTSNHKAYVRTFVDDIFVGDRVSADPNRHLDQLEAWLKTCEEHDLVLNTKDLCFLCPTVLGLGYRLGNNEIAIPFDRREALKNLATPTSKDILIVALATYNFYKELIPHYADFNVRFRDLLKGNAPWIWTEAHDEAWADFKKMLDDEKHGIAMAYDDTKPVVIRPDASDYGLGATMLQYDHEWKKLRPVLYYSARIDDADVKIASTTIKEAFSGYSCLVHWAPLLVGKRILMQYDHLPIIGFVPKNSASAAKHWRWFKDHQAFDVKYEHIPGKENSIADLFSRLHHLDEEPSLSSTVQRLLKSRQDDDPALTDLRAAALDPNHQVADPKAKLMLKALGGTDKIEIVNGVLYIFAPGRYRQQSRRVLLPDSLVREYLDAAHTDPMAGHLRGPKFRDRLTHVWWLSKDKDIDHIEDNCAICLRVKSVHTTYTGTHQAASIDTPFSRWTIDFFEIFGQKILAGIEAFTNYPEARIVDGETADNATDFVFNEILTRHGRFQKLRSDNGPAFTAAAFKAFAAKYLITQEFSLPDRPQGHGHIERLNRTLEDIIRCVLPSLGNNLPRALAAALWAYRSATYPGTGYSPHELATGRKPLLFHPMELDPYSDTLDVKEFATTLLANLEKLNLTAINSKESYAANLQRVIDARAVPHPFKVGDLVGVAREFDKNRDIARFDGPFKIIDLPGPNSVTIDVPPGPKKLSITKIKPFAGIMATPPLPVSTPAESQESSWITPPMDLLPEQLLFKRVKVHWGNKQWFTGTVQSIYNNKHFVLYDDKDAFNDPVVPEGLTLPKKRPKYRVLASDFGPASVPTT
jgi:transposase InsO family protein